MNNNRVILEKYIKKLDNNEKSKAKELRLNPAEVRELHLAIVKLLLDNAEITEHNRNLISALSTVSQETDVSVNLDGGTF